MPKPPCPRTETTAYRPIIRPAVSATKSTGEAAPWLWLVASVMPPARARGCHEAAPSASGGSDRNRFQLFRAGGLAEGRGLGRGLAVLGRRELDRPAGAAVGAPGRRRNRPGGDHGGRRRCRRGGPGGGLDRVGRGRIGLGYEGVLRRLG